MLICYIYTYICTDTLVTHYIRVCKYTCMYIYIYIYIHIHYGDK